MVWTLGITFLLSPTAERESLAGTSQWREITIAPFFVVMQPTEEMVVWTPEEMLSLAGASPRRKTGLASLRARVPCALHVIIPESGIQWIHVGARGSHVPNMGEYLRSPGWRRARGIWVNIKI